MDSDPSLSISELLPLRLLPNGLVYRGVPGEIAAVALILGS